VDKPYIGGQAVLEGVMMRSPHSFVVAVRRPDGTIAVRDQVWGALLPKAKVLRWPFMRGAVVLLESLHNGFSAIKFSADQAMPDSSQDSSKEGAPSSGLSETGSSMLLFMATLVMVGLFIAAPHLLTYAVARLFHVPLDPQGVAFHVVDGAFRIVILLGYILAISRSKEAKRLFQYHGAEHKAIWAYESGKALTVENARAFTTLHPRCGTSFLFIVVLVAVALHALIIPFVPRMSSHDFVNQLFLIGVKVPLAFPVAGLAYELQRLSAKPSCPRWLTLLMRPGMWMQHITTREPTADQLEIALLALGRALAREEGRAPATEGVRIYPDFAVAQGA
jgi:uncharacterized protein YqhQ